MMNRIGLHSLRLTALVLALSASAAYAGKIELGTADGDAVVAILDSDSRVFVNAFRVAMTEKNKRGPFTGNAKRHLFKATKQATVARLDYTFTKEGREVTRTYYARSGPAMSVTFDRMDGTRGGSSGGSSGPYVMTADDIKADSTESKYYPKDTDVRARARNLEVKENGVVANDAIHAGDAELKIFRQIEFDIGKGTVAEGGRLAGYVSKAVCPSCKAASERLASVHNIEGNIYQLIEPGVEAPASAAEGESVRLSGVLRRQRDLYLNDHVVDRFVPLDAPSVRVPDPIERIEAEEARQATASPCND